MADEKLSPEEDISDDDLDQIIQNISKEEMPVAPAAAPAPTAAPVAKAAAPISTLGVLPGKKAAAAKPEQSLNLELNGVINLKLCFSSGERSIEVFCTEEALICRMADGTEFKIPTGIDRKRSAA